MECSGTKDMQSGYDFSRLSRDAQTRWLKPAEVFSILQNCEDHQITHQVPQKPPSGSLYLFDKRKQNFFRKDGHSWRRRKNQNAVAEAHERLKVQNVETLNCCYAHGEGDRKFQRRIYWILFPNWAHIVLVHYRYTSEGRRIARSTSQVSPLSSSTFSHSPTPNSLATSQPAWSFAIDEFNELHRDQSSLGSGESSSREVIMNERINDMEVREQIDEANSSSSFEVYQALQSIEQRLNLDDNETNESNTFYIEDDESYRLEDIFNELSGDRTSDLDYLCPKQHPVDGIQHHHFSGVDTDNWKDMLDNSKSTSDMESGAQPGRHDATTSSMNVPLEDESVEHLVRSPELNSYGVSTDFFFTLHDQGEMGMSLGNNKNGKQKFTIQEISPAWCYSSEGAKVIIIGYFLCDPSEVSWACMFGDIEVPIQIIRPDIICCYAPPNLQGKVTLSITSGNKESCSEVKEFEYRSEPSVHSHRIPSGGENFRSSEELLLLVEFVQILLSDLPPTGYTSETRVAKTETSEDVWNKVMDSILTGASTSFTTIYWILQEVLKDKLSVWLSSRSCTEQNGCYLSRKGHGIIHLAAGMGFEWALQPILDSGVNVNFRDAKGWTALHWAAKFGREKMVAALIASGASAGAITDPTAQDPTGKTAASIATAGGHKGVASYVSEVALTSHLSSLVLEEYEISKGSAAVEAEKMVNRLSMPSPSKSENRESLQYALEAARAAVEAAARIQSAFRAHSFRSRQQREAAARARMSLNYCTILENDILELSAASKQKFGKVYCNSSAALSIQKSFRGWKCRKDYHSIRKKVVKIQAHVRGHQVRKKYNVKWAVSILEKVILRWRRHGDGLRGFQLNSENMESEDEDSILKVFRKKNVEAVIDEAVATVLSMVKCPTARLQYGRIFAEYRLAKGPSSGESRCVMSSYHAFSFVGN